VDVMLVLLVVFMVTAPLMIVGVPVNLPKTAANFLPNQLEVPLEITLTGTGEYLVMNTPVKLNELKKYFCGWMVSYSMKKLLK